MAPRTASSGMIPALDHLILLVNDPHKASSQIDSALERAICTFSELGFQVVRGGVHADGITSNALIVFADGVYIELIQFEPAPGLSSGETQAQFEARRKKHWWYNSRPGWIDWCLLDGVSDGMVQSINDNASRLRQTALEEEQGATHSDEMRIVAPRLHYLDAQEGGRVTMTGQELRWKVTFPSPPEGGVGNARSAVPFWCCDLTPRGVRVPLERSVHENRSPGIAEITLLYARDTVAAYLDISLALNQPIDASTLPISSDLQLVPNQIPHRLLAAPAATHKPDATLKGQGHPHHEAQTLQKLIRVNVKVAEDPQDLEWIESHGEGLYEVAIYAHKLAKTAPPDGIEQTTFRAGFGRIRLSPILH